MLHRGLEFTVRWSVGRAFWVKLDSRNKVEKIKVRVCIEI